MGKKRKQPSEQSVFDYNRATGHYGALVSTVSSGFREELTRPDPDRWHAFEQARAALRFLDHDGNQLWLHEK